MTRHRPLQFGIVRNQNMPWDTVLRQFLWFEELGFDSVWGCDHFQRPSRPDDPIIEGWTMLAALAAHTKRSRLGLLVSSNTFRHPPLLAKQAMTVDHISNGRLELGIGTGWWEPEHRSFGLPFPDPPELVGRFAEAVELVDLLLRQDVTTYAGAYYQVKDAIFRPRPVQQPRPPLTLGAHGPRMLGIVAKYADRWNSYGTTDELRERGEHLDEACAKIGRDPNEIIRSLYGWTLRIGADPWESTDAFQDVVGRYREVGITEFLIEAPFEEQFPMMERIVAEVLPVYRSQSHA